MAGCSKAILEGKDLVCANDGGDDAAWNYLRVALLLEEKLWDAVGPALTEILEIAAQEFGIEKDDHYESMKRREISRTATG